MLQFFEGVFKKYVNVNKYGFPKGRERERGTWHGSTLRLGVKPSSWAPPLLRLAGKVLVPSSVTPIWNKRLLVWILKVTFPSNSEPKPLFLDGSPLFSLKAAPQMSFVLAAGLGFSAWGRCYMGASSQVCNASAVHRGCIVRNAKLCMQLYLGQAMRWRGVEGVNFYIQRTEKLLFISSHFPSFSFAGRLKHWTR